MAQVIPRSLHSNLTCKLGCIECPSCQALFLLPPVPAQERQALAHRLLELKPNQAVITPYVIDTAQALESRFPENVSQNTTLAYLAGRLFIGLL